jgi:hypothetical protein
MRSLLSVPALTLYPGSAKYGTRCRPTNPSGPATNTLYCAFMPEFRSLREEPFTSGIELTEQAVAGDDQNQPG